MTVCNLSAVNCSCKGARYTFMTLSTLILFDTHNKMTFRAISDFQNYVRKNVRLGQILFVFPGFNSQPKHTDPTQKALSFTVYPAKQIPNAIMYHCIYLIYHIQLNNNVSRCLFPGNFALTVPCNPLLAGAPSLSVSSCPAGHAKSQQDLRSVCIQLWHQALWRFALYIVCLQTRGISRTQRDSSVFVLRWLASWQIALGQKRVTEENVLHQFYQ